MPLEFPLSRTFQNRLRIAPTSLFRLERYEQTSGLANGQPLNRIMAPPKWIAEFALVPMRAEEAAGIAGVLDALGSSERVRLYDPAKRFAAADPNGALLDGRSLVVSAIGADNRSLRIAGLPGGFVVTEGDMISVGYGSPERRALFRAAETVAASGLGQTPSIEVRPHAPEGLAVGQPAILTRPYGLFVISDVQTGTADRALVTGMRFSARQVPV